MLGAALLTAVLVGALLTLAGCVWVEGEAEQVGEEPATSSSQGILGPILPSGTGGDSPEVLMMGRSIMYDWFDYDGWDGRNELRREGYWFFYGELETPPTIAESADAMIEQVPDPTILYFQLYFDDFWASNDSEIQANLEENLGYVRQVVEAANERDMVLILGNALPKVRVHTTPALVDTHIAYNEELERIAAENDNVHVFDQWGVLADPQDGALARGLSVTSDNSHLSNIAYEEMTPELLDLLGMITIPPHGDM
jgi:hypothetical protein